MKFPIGIQQFEEIRSGDWVYIDKTAFIHHLVSSGKYFFLSRPRRFGKSLLMSTIEAYFKGKKHLFEGLAMENLEHEWIEYPVLHIDLNAEKYDSVDELHNILDTYLRGWEKIYGSDEGGNDSLSRRFLAVIRAAKIQTSRNVVVLIDEYDKPMLQAIGNEELQTELRNMLKAFYGTLKSADGDLKFVLLTGVTKFSKVSVFSDLNNLEDISMKKHYHDICGITEDELRHYFDSEIEKLAEHNSQSKDEAYATLRHKYDGYHFCDNVPGVYNPFSILLSIKNLEYKNYWFSTGTPTYLVELLKRFDFPLEDLSGYETTEDALDSIQIRTDNPIPVLYQSGYLTIKGYDRDLKLYTLDFPNEEVEESFIRFLIPMYSPISETESPAFIGKFVREVRAGETDAFMRRLQALMADTPYEIIKDLENHYQNVMFILTKLMGFYVQAEYRTSYGRIDLLISTDKYVYVIELKIDGTPEEALEQINRKEYALPFTAGDRQIIKIGANISREKRNLESWKIMNTLFNLDKAIQSILYVSNKLKRKDFHKIFKILYFADRNHLSDYGRMITGDTYIAMNDGPVPSNMYDILKGLRGDGFFCEEAKKFSKYFIIENWNFVNPKVEADLRFLSESDIEYLDDSIREYGDLTWDEIREKSHDYAWRNTVKDRPISMKNLLLEKGDSDEYIEFVDDMNEIKRLIGSL